MNSVLRPRGPAKASVYWRRRAAALLLLVCMPLVLGFLVFGGGGGQPQAAPPSSQPTDQPSDQPSGQPSEAASGTPSADPSAAASANPSSGATAPACPQDDLAVTVATDKQTYPAGQNPQITLTITNTSDTDCQRDIGSGANEIVVTSGGHHVWSSNDCDPSQASNVQVLPAGAKAQVTVTWERKLSAPGCTGSASPAQPGSYQAVAINGQIQSAPARFSLQ